MHITLYTHSNFLFKDDQFNTRPDRKGSEDEDEEVRLLKDQFKMSEHLNLKLRVRKKSLYFEDVLLGFRSQDLREVKLCSILVKAI